MRHQASVPAHSVRWIMEALALPLFYFSMAAPAAHAGDQIQIPVRWCALKGSPVASNPDRNTVLWRRHELASDRIWIRGPNITFRSAIIRELLDIDKASFPVIEDPRKPPSGPGVEGDILNPIGAAGADAELKEARTSCQAAWDALEIEVNQKRAMMNPPLPPVNVEGPIVINLRQFVDQSGNAGFLGGVGFFGSSPSNGYCLDPPNISSVDPNYIFAGVKDNTFLSGDADDELLAHEFGHVLALEHGNGLDDDNDDNDMNPNTGRFDGYGGSGCDPDENPNATPFSLMATSTNDGTDLLTPLQRARARAAAAKTPGMKFEPPGTLLDGDTFADHRADPPHDVTDSTVDIVSAGMVVNTADQTTTLSHMLFSVIPSPPFGAKQYLMFLDLDGDPATGGPPSSLGLPTDFEGAELVTRVTVTHTGEIPSVVITPTVWTFQSGGFVVVSDPSILARLATVKEAETGVESFDVVSIRMSNGVRGDLSEQLRLQAVAAQLSGDQLDQLPDGPTNGSSPLFMVPPQFPACGVTPATVPPGGTAVVEATGLGPDQIVKVLVGDQMVAAGMADATGNATVLFSVPSTSPQGTRLVTVGTMGTALTADCSVDVQGTAVHEPAIQCPAAASAECGSPSGTGVTLSAVVTDPDGDPLTVTWTVDGTQVQVDSIPGGSPTTHATVTLEHAYALGDHTVGVTVSDATTSNAACSTTVTIADTTPPVVRCSVASPILTNPPNHFLVNVGLIASAQDACEGTLASAVAVFGDEEDEQPTGDGVFSPDARDLASGRLRLRAERVGILDGRVYLIAAGGTDSGGNTAVNCCTEAVPRDFTAASIASVAAQAAGAEAFCEANGGDRPPGYFVIGDGPVIGKKQ